MMTQSSSGNLPLGVLGGVMAAAVGAILWAVITVSTKFQIGFMAIGVGFLVAYAVRFLGKGSSLSFRLVGAACALGGCVLGNLLTVCGFMAAEQSAPVVQVVAGVLGRPALATTLMSSTFQAMDLLFYAIAVYEGFKLSVVNAAAPAPTAT